MFKHKKALLKSYQKLLKKEGLAAPAVGAVPPPRPHDDDDDETSDAEAAAEEHKKRERVEEEGEDDDDSDSGAAASSSSSEDEGGSGDEEEEEEERGKGTQPKKKAKRFSKPDPFLRAKQAAKERRRAVEVAQREREERAAAKARGVKQRKARHALMSQRTRRGQPVMKNRITSILAKLQQGEG